MPVLSDGVVTLRAHSPADIDAMVEMANDPEMQRWTAIPVPSTRETTEEFALSIIPRGWDEGRMRGWAIEAPDEHGAARYVGNVDIRGEGPVTDIGYALHPAARGRGLMSRAVRLAMGHVLAEEGVEVIHWRCRVGHEASLRVAHQCGFTLHGTTPGLLVERGEVHDAWTGSFHFGDTPLPRNQWVESVVLESDQVRLRPFREDDVARIVESCSDPDTQHWLNGLPRPYTDKVARDYLADCTWRAAAGLKASWAVADPDSDLLLGNVAVMDLTGLNPTTAEVGYWMHPDARGRGLMSQAVRLVTAHAFDERGLARRRLSLLAAAGNPASQRVAEKAGFTQVGIEHQAELLGDGSVDDLVSYELLAADR
ncbi:GNAT family N-acetyltransferase [Aeromicrobium sp. CTD01-1L150]|uniref:GNAT family N-acetyltransferase n=1 Tax=Aeromicrobium sp. CTD01-1L150 TaxID=3341830 RepID=UPI0035BEC88D